MKSSDVAKILSELAEVLNKNNLTDIEYSSENESFCIRKHVVIQNGTSNGVYMSHNNINQPTVTLQDQSQQAQARDVIVIKSPIVGVAYLASSPSSAPFVSIGTQVKAGDVVMIVEAMKVMNEVKSTQSGKVSKICVNNGEVVEFGQILIELS